MIDRARLAESLGQLDPGTRALLDLSLRRAIPDDQVAKVLGVEPSLIPPRRARGIAQLADMMEVPGPSELAALLIAIPELPEDAWGVPAPAPFAGDVSRARRAKAFRRVAVAASPLVALGAVIAALAISSSPDHSGGGSGSAVAHRGGSGGGAQAPAAASAPHAGHGSSSSVFQQLAAAKTKAARQSTGHAAGHAARHHRARHRSGAGQEAGAGQDAFLAREPVHAVKHHSAPVSYHPAPVVPQEPHHVTHHQAPAQPKHPAVKPSPAPAPAPVHTPSQPVPVPVTPVQSVPVHVSAPVSQVIHHLPSPSKLPKPQVPQPNVGQPGDDGGDDDDQGGCGDQGAHAGYAHHSQPAAQHQSAGGKRFSPPGLFRTRHGR